MKAKRRTVSLSPAAALAHQRWAKASKEEKHAVGQKLAEARWGKRRKRAKEQT